MILLDGITLSGQILSDIKSEIANRKSIINLHVILVGDDSASLKYVSLKEKKCQQVGINFQFHHLPENTTESELLFLINQLNQDQKVTGFFVQLPLPKHINTEILEKINPQKDVDGLTTNSSFIPAVDVGVMSLLKSTNVNLSGKNAVIINTSKLIGIPLQKLLVDQNINVTLCNRSTQNLLKISRGADLLISATGQKGLITSKYIKPGAIVIDIGGGDVKFEEVKEKCSFITPPIGSVGPMTIACLLKNLTMVK